MAYFKALSWHSDGARKLYYKLRRKKVFKSNIAELFFFAELFIVEKKISDKKY
jgi:hypothetical protein